MQPLTPVARFLRGMVLTIAVLVQDEGREPDVTVAWGETPTTQLLINGIHTDIFTLNRLIGALRRARDQVYGTDV